MNFPKVLIIDAGLGNIGSIIAAFTRQNCTFQNLKYPPSKDENEFTHVVLPGVGAFEAGIKALIARNWDSWIQENYCILNRPILGICLGMQLLATEGQEGAKKDETIKGLNLIPGKVNRLTQTKGLLLPHVGWNSVDWNKDHKVCKGIPKNGDFYFVHSYCFEPRNPNHIIASSSYGKSFASVVGIEKCIGVQFHPEKSQRLGKKLLTNFLMM